MKYLLLLILFCSVVRTAECQEKTALMDVVNAEKSFAAYAGAEGITNAFMKFLHDSAKVFEGGKILNGKEVWKERKTDSMELTWYPEFAEVAASGDFGYTTGPSEFRLKKGSERADHKGIFSSIWQKDKNGVWMVMLDIGTSSPQSEYDTSKVEYNKIKSTPGKIKKLKKESNEDEIRKVEEKFIADYDNGKAYVQYASPSARYNRPQEKVAKGAVVLNDSLEYSYKNVGTGISSSGDLGYAYGFLNASGKEGNYLRVWMKEMGLWKIVLDAASY